MIFQTEMLAYSQLTAANLRRVERRLIAAYIDYIDANDGEAVYDFTFSCVPLDTLNVLYSLVLNKQ